VGKVCGSGLQSVILGAQSILTQESQIVIAGGQESMSNAPYLLPQEARTGLRLGHKELTDSLIWDGLWDPGSNLHMGSCAESCVQEFQLTRQDQDAYALESYKRARLSLEKGFFQQEIVPVPSALGNFIEVDEEPFVADLTKMSSLRPAFEKNGTITAGNASKINDGAAAVLLASGKAIQNYSLGPPLAQIIAWSRYADSPKRFAVAPIFAIENLLKKAHKTVQDIDLYEINEAFALVPLMIMKALGIPHEKVNVRGGACALGHPIGASGARILTTLLFSLFQLRKKYGLATVCIGGGEALAILVESLLP
jgi:acetyl-CoA C-acetyltransferase